MTLVPESRIVLAPLAGGPSTPELAVAVANAGGLPFLAAGYLAPPAFSEQLAHVRALTDEPFGVNIFVLRERRVDTAAVAAYADELCAEARERGVEPGEPHFDDDGFDTKLSLALEAGAAIVSFTFGCPSAADLERVRAAGSESWLTVTNVAEARAAVEAGAAALIVQGAEAGGHRGTWNDDHEVDVPLLELVRAIAATVELPLVATGGIADRTGVIATLDAGAVAAQIGSAFLLAPEAGTSEPHRRAIAAAGETAVTRAFTGRRARGIVNGFMRRHPDAPSAYPHIHHLTAPLRAAARAAGDSDGINLWAGTSHALARAEPAAAIVERLRA